MEQQAAEMICVACGCTQIDPCVTEDGGVCELAELTEGSEAGLCTQCAGIIADEEGGNEERVVLLAYAKRIERVKAVEWAVSEFLKKSHWLKPWYPGGDPRRDWYTIDAARLGKDNDFKRSLIYLGARRLLQYRGKDGSIARISLSVVLDDNETPPPMAPHEFERIYRAALVATDGRSWRTTEEPLTHERYVKLAAAVKRESEMDGERASIFLARYIALDQLLTSGFLPRRRTHKTGAAGEGQIASTVLSVAATLPMDYDPETSPSEAVCWFDPDAFLAALNVN